MIINPTMLKGLGSLISGILGSFAVDQDRARIQGPGRGAERIEGTAPLIPVEVQQLEKSQPVLSPEDILLDKEGFPVMRDEDFMQSEFDLPYILTPGGGRPEPQQPADMDIRDLLNMLFNRG